jgi:ribosomal protein S18 acetylase RimI-like enzyme
MALALEIRSPLPSELASISVLLRENGWAHRMGDAEWFTRLMAASRAAVAVDDGQVIGFARGITDGLSNGYLSMVVVSPEHRCRGVGSALVRHLMGRDAGITWMLRTGRPGAREFFAKLGFHVSADAMERPRA